MCMVSQYMTSCMSECDVHTCRSEAMHDAPSSPNNCNTHAAVAPHAGLAAAEMDMMLSVKLHLLYMTLA